MISFDDDLIPLADVCLRYFNVQPHIAIRKAAKGTLPIPAFRLNGGSRGPLYVKKSDLEALAARTYEQAAELTSKMRSVGAV